MLTGKDLIDADYIVQKRTSYVTVFSDIRDFEFLSASDIGSENYQYDDVETNFDNCESDLWIEKDGVGRGVSARELEAYMEGSETIEEFEAQLEKR